MAYNEFPSPNSIPPPSFYNIQGLSSYLNHNPIYKHYFINYPDYFPLLFTSTYINNGGTPYENGSPVQTLANYNLENVPLPLYVTTLSNSQLNKYKRYISLFLKIYSYNYNVYIKSITYNETPYYYNQYRSYEELMDYRSAIQFINKLYPFDMMANGQNENGEVLGWVVPFPF